MNFFNLNKPKVDIKASETWRHALISRENKKGTVPVNTMVTEQLTPINPSSVVSLAVQTICTNENFTKSAEDNQKIKNVQDELSKVDISPQFAY